MSIQSSILCRWLLALWHAWQGLWANSALGGWFHRRRENFQAAGKTSRVCRFLAREGAVRRGWEDSIFRRAFSGILNLPVTIAKGVYRLAKGLWDGSLAFRGVTALGRGAWALLGLFVLVMLVAPHERWENLYGFLGAAGIYFLYALGCANRRERRLEVGRLGPWFAFYFLFISLALVCSLSVGLSLRFYLFHLTCFFLVLVAVSAVDDVKKLKTLMVCGAVGVTVAALYGCYQGYIGVDVVASQQDMILNKDMPGRVYSFFDNPNNFAEVLVMLTPLTLALTINAKGWRGKVLGIFSLVAEMGALGLTYSRSSWLGLALAAVVFFALLDWRFLPALAVLGVCAIPFLPQSIWNRILTIGNMKDSSARYRLAIYEDTGRLLRDHGLMGTGLGSDVMRKVFLHYPTLYDGNYPIHTHNNYLQMWGETGIFGLLAFLGLILGQIKEGLQAIRRADRELRRVLAAALGALAGILAIGLVEYTWFYPRNMFLFWYLFAIVAATVKLIWRQGEETA